MTLMVSDMNGLIIDCFAGGGGASKGIELALNRPIDIAINHDPEAIRIHKANHPHTLHLTEDIFTVDLQKDVAMMMALLKVARIKAGDKADSFIDLAGYAACAGEIVTERSCPYEKAETQTQE